MTKERKKKRAAGEATTKKRKAKKAEASAGVDPGTTEAPEDRTTYTPELGKHICMRVAMGETLRGISLDPTMPPNSTMHEWRSIHEDFAVNYARARQARADARSDKIDRLIDQMLKGEIKSDVARVAIDALKWQAGREQPKRYGDKIVSEHVGRDGPTQTAETRDVVKDHLEGLSKRFAAGLKLIEGDKNVDHLEGLSQRYANGSKALDGGASDEDALNAASARRLQEHRRRDN